MWSRWQTPLRQRNVQQLLPQKRQKQKTMEMWSLKTICCRSLPKLLHKRIQQKKKSLINTQTINRFPITLHNPITNFPPQRQRTIRMISALLVFSSKLPLIPITIETIIKIIEYKHPWEQLHPKTHNCNPSPAPTGNLSPPPKSNPHLPPTAPTKSTKTSSPIPK